MSIGSAELRVTLPPTLSGDEARLLLAVKLYEVGRTSLGQSAEMAEVSVRTFIEMLGKQHIAVIDYPPGELAEEVER